METVLTLESMQIENFKGIDSLNIRFAPKRTDIFGDNATGKTTIVDAFDWLLFDKDSENQTNFNIKPLDENGKVAQHGAESSVTATINANGTEYELRKTYREKWTSKRGAAEKTFSGHETTYYIDGIPKPKNAYTKFIKGLIDENNFRIVTSPSFMEENLDWKSRRQVLTDIVGTIPVDAVLGGDPALEVLADDLKKHSQDDLLKKITSDIRRVNSERNALPARIDELHRLLPDQMPDEDAERTVLDNLHDAIMDAERNLAEVQAGSNASKIGEILAQITLLRADLNNSYTEAVNAYNDAKTAYFVERGQYERRIEDAQHHAAELEKSISTAQTMRELKGKEYQTVKAQIFDPGTGLCPTCSQKIPPEQMAEKEEHFNIEKSQRLEQLVAEGFALKDQVESGRKKLEALQATIASEQDGMNALCEPKFPPNVTKEDTDEIKALLAEVDSLKSDGKSAQQEQGLRLKAKIADLREQEKLHRATLAEIEGAVSAKARIDELTTQAQALAEESERLESMKYACEEYSRERAHILEDRINRMFTVVKWKLFKTLINGGIEETCELTVDGVPWSDLNSAMRINAGIDVINTLSKHYGISAPVFIDNAETITNLEPLNGQLIRLVVSEADKVLRIMEVE